MKCKSEFICDLQLTFHCALRVNLLHASAAAIAVLLGPDAAALITQAASSDCLAGLGPCGSVVLYAQHAKEHHTAQILLLGTFVVGTLLFALSSQIANAFSRAHLQTYTGIS
jgi:hypothetical protein